jgi:hypothetical protein
MRKILVLLLALAVLVVIPSFASAKHAERLHNKMSEHNHKKRMKKAAKESPGAAKHKLLHHK